MVSEWGILKMMFNVSEGSVFFGRLRPSCHFDIADRPNPAASEVMVDMGNRAIFTMRMPRDGPAAGRQKDRRQMTAEPDADGRCDSFGI